MKCARCECRRYCGKDCQKQDWPSHKRVCDKSLSNQLHHKTDKLIVRFFFLLRGFTAHTEFLHKKIQNREKCIEYLYDYAELQEVVQFLEKQDIIGTSSFRYGERQNPLPLRQVRAQDRMTFKRLVVDKTRVMLPLAGTDPTGRAILQPLLNGLNRFDGVFMVTLAVKKDKAQSLPQTAISEVFDHPLGSNNDLPISFY